MEAFRRAIEGLIPQVRKRAADAEINRTLPVETIENLREIGLFRAFVPRTYGGDERSLLDVLDPITDLASGCASTAWVSALAAIHNIAVCWLAKPAQEEIFGEGPDILIASSVAPTGTLLPVQGGFRLAGRWAFSSGVDHAAWLMLGGAVKSTTPAAPPDYFLSFVRVADVARIDDWHVSGLRATGSRSVELTDVFVPEHRALLLRSVREGTAPGLSVHPGHFYRLPWEALFSSAFPPAALGTAIAMLEGFREYTVSRLNVFSGGGFRGNAGSAMRMAEAAARVDAARLIYRRDLAALDRCAQDGMRAPDGLAERIVYDAPFVVDSCSEAILRLFRGSGGRAIRDGNPLQRYFRDIHAMTQHASLEMDNAGETYGRALFRNPAWGIGVRDLYQ